MTSISPLIARELQRRGDQGDGAKDVLERGREQLAALRAGVAFGTKQDLSPVVVRELAGLKTARKLLGLDPKTQAQ